MITAAILTKNNEKTIKNTIKSLNWCNKIIIIDDYSTDNTVKISKKFKAKIIRRKLANNYSSQRNSAFKYIKSGWVLFIDSDEVVSKRLAKEINFAITDDKVSGYLIKRIDIFNNRKMKGGEAGSTFLLRLAKFNKGRWQRKVHEIWNISGEVKYLKNPIYHYPHPTLLKFFEDINKYSTLHAKENIVEMKKISTLKIILYPVAKFITNFIIKGGYKDGTYGFVHAMTMSLHSYLSWSKSWLQINYKHY